MGIKVYKLYDMSGYIHDMDIYLGKERTCVTADMRAAHVTAKTPYKVEVHRHNSLHRLTYVTTQQTEQSIAAGQ
jgi:hypothetical protein